MRDQDWKTGRLNRQKYVVSKPCSDCDGEGTRYDPNSFLPCSDPSVDPCPCCGGKGMLPASKDASYFVLRIDCGPDGPCDPHARKALAVYADSVAEENLEFAADIRRWLKEIEEPGP